jgi:hypothetical protein
MWVMTMKYNMSKGTIAKLSIGAVFVLLLALASVAPSGAVRYCPPASCTKCVTEGYDDADCWLEHRCVALCRYNGVTYYGYFEREVCIYQKWQECTPQSLCTVNKQCIPTGPTEDNLCKGTIKKTGRWVLLGIGPGGCDNDT